MGSDRDGVGMLRRKESVLGVNEALSPRPSHKLRRPWGSSPAASGWAVTSGATELSPTSRPWLHDGVAQGVCAELHQGPDVDGTKPVCKGVSGGYRCVDAGLERVQKL